MAWLLTVLRCAVFVLAAAGAATGQSVTLRSADTIALPAPITDGNSPAFWNNGWLRVFTSTGKPVSMAGRELDRLRLTPPPIVTPAGRFPIWIEAVWRDPNGTVYGWYHHESPGSCSHNGLVTPMIGALVSNDGGRTFTDLGVVLSSGDAEDCDARNGFFAGGHGDFSVILDQSREFFYFLFTNYSGPDSSQGVAAARMAYADRVSPAGTVYKYHEGGWEQPGIGGAVTPFYRASASWLRADTDSFWGPAVHWNSYLEKYVVLLNRACCETGWPQEGIYIAFNPDVGDPDGWSTPRKLAGEDELGISPAYYPQAFGTRAPETDTLVGEVARFFVKGVSGWEIVFSREEFAPPPEAPEGGPEGSRHPRLESSIP